MRHLAYLELPGLEIEVRDAARADLPTLLELLADDQRGATRDAPTEDWAPYLAAFEAIERDPAHRLLVCGAAGQVIAMLQLSLIPGLSRRGARRVQLEAVRTHADYRGRGLGKKFLQWCIGYARSQGCSLVQLTTDKSRAEAHRFYAELGFKASHEGMKLQL
ncbi:GNAT family N-acetyltransferase [Arthrobacter sp. AQ5-05]|uniref:GNAT family N-acetyltransferase n=1 Tax=Arthrobacter sp. AQ5-05 TaxID=2184581 RepID=UPI000DCBD416|nr:GNAT family N-acetyltransferase [Arthrobacter sp. AQ5-05]RAX50286.1 GNAT family N-acetyltransferase [Arthrobacter sp. AQ5-05]